MSKRDQLTITLVQTHLNWEDVDKNILLMEKHLSKVKATDIIVLPEMFTTGFSMNTALAESMEGKTIQWMKRTARRMKSAICGSLMLKEGKRCYNRFVWVMPNGDICTYDKRHLFTLAGEDKFYTKGKDRVMINYKGWNIMPLVCYDLRFPVWSRSVKGETDLMIYVANWPEVRATAWQQLLPARAIENQCFVAGVNRVGKDAKGNNHKGNSVVVDYAGKTIAQGQENKQWVKQVKLDKKALELFKEKLSFWADADKYTLQS